MLIVFRPSLPRIAPFFFADEDLPSDRSAELPGLSRAVAMTSHHGTS